MFPASFEPGAEQRGQDAPRGRPPGLKDELVFELHASALGGEEKAHEPAAGFLHVRKTPSGPQAEQEREEKSQRLQVLLERQQLLSEAAAALLAA